MKQKLNTKPFGVVEIDERQIISFPDGILGFEDIRHFALLDSNEDNSPFKWLQACEETSLAFVVITPESFMTGYEPDISQSDLAAVDCVRAEDLLVLCIVTIPEDPAKMTANLQGPVIINREKRIGRQAISMSEKYSVRHFILEEAKKAAGIGGE